MADSYRKRRSSLTMGERLLFLAGILFCLILITTAMLGGLFARYTTSGSGSDSARVAKFGNLTLTETGDFDGTAGKKGMIIPGVALTKNATVTFTGSEMATVVFVEVIVPKDTWETTDNVLFSYGGMSWSVASGWTYLKTDEDTVGNIRHVYYQTLVPNAELVNEPIVKDGQIQVNEDITKDGIFGLANAELSFRASVIQAGGFESVKEAWAAMAAK